MDMINFFYRVQKQDTILELSIRFKVPIGVLIRDNNLKADISEGDLLFINRPNGTPYTVEVGDTLSSLAKRFGVTEDTLALKNNSPYLLYGEIIYY